MPSQTQGDKENQNRKIKSSIPDKVTVDLT